MSKAWPKTKLGDVLQSVERAESVDAAREYRLLGVRWYGEGFFEKDRKLGQEIKAQKVYRVHKGDFAYNRLFAWKGSFAVADDEADGCYVSNEFPCFEPVAKRVDAAFLKWWFRRENAWVDALGLSSGATPTSRNRLKEQHFLAMEIPLPPLAEQRRIVARIEELAAQIREAHSLREETARVTEDVIGKFSARMFDSIKSVTLPLGEVAEKKTGVAYKADDFVESGDIPVVRLKEIGTKNPTAYLKNADNYANVWLEVGDIVLAKTSFSTGAMCQWPGPRAVLNQNAVMLRARESVEQRFLYAWLGQQVFRYLSDHLADPKFYPYIREADLVQWLVPVPTLPEQRRIVAELDALQAEVDTLKRLQAESAAELDALLPAILDRAFKGEL